MIMSTKPYFNQPTLNLFRETVKNLKASALSIIAESKEVEVLILKTNILSYLPETEKDKIYTDIAKVNDPDKPASMSEIMRIKNSEKKWEGFRSRLVKDIRKSQFMDRHKGALKR
jgi:lipopolysaccharide export system protein LptC